MRSKIIAHHLDGGAQASPSHPEVACAKTGVALLAAALCLFIAIAVAVTQGGALVRLDARIAFWLHGHATDGLTCAALLVARSHGTTGIIVLACWLGWHFWRRRALDWLRLLAVAIPGGMVLNVALKHAFTRPRPVFDDPLLTLDTFSFPSGHTASATLLYGIAALWLASRTAGAGRRAAIVAGAALMVALVGASRLYLGVHYASDVLAACAESGAWLLLCVGAAALSPAPALARPHPLSR